MYMMDYKQKYMKYKTKYFYLNQCLNIDKKQINFDKVLVYKGKKKEKIEVFDDIILKKEDITDDYNFFYCSNDLKYEIKLLNDDEKKEIMNKKSKCRLEYEKDDDLTVHLKHNVYGLYINEVIVLTAILNNEIDLEIFDSSFVNELYKLNSPESDITKDYNIIDITYKGDYQNFIEPKKKTITINNYIGSLCKLDLTPEEKEKIKIINDIPNIKLFKYMLDYFKSIVQGNLYLVGYNGIDDILRTCKSTEKNNKLIKYYKNNNFKKTKFYNMVCWNYDGNWKMSFSPLLELENNLVLYLDDYKFTFEYKSLYKLRNIIVCTSVNNFTKEQIRFAIYQSTSNMFFRLFINLNDLEFGKYLNKNKGDYIMNTILKMEFQKFIFENKDKLAFNDVEYLEKNERRNDIFINNFFYKDLNITKNSENIKLYLISNIEKPNFITEDDKDSFNNIVINCKCGNKFNSFKKIDRTNNLFKQFKNVDLEKKKLELLEPFRGTPLYEQQSRIDYIELLHFFKNLLKDKLEYIKQKELFLEFTHEVKLKYNIKLIFNINVFRSEFKCKLKKDEYYYYHLEYTCMLNFDNQDDTDNSAFLENIKKL